MAVRRAAIGGLVLGLLAGSRRWIGSPLFATLLWVVSFAVIFAAFAATGNNLYDLYRLDRSGVSTSATITALDPSNHTGCDYRYVVAGRPFTGTRERCALSAAPGDRIEIRYLPADPRVSKGTSPIAALLARLAIALLIPSVLVLAVRRKATGH